MRKKIRAIEQEAAAQQERLELAIDGAMNAQSMSKSGGDIDGEA